MVWAVGILGRVTIGMVHPVQDCVGPWRKVRASLADPSEDIEEPFPKFGHDKHLVRCVPVKEEALAKQGEIPVK